MESKTAREPWWPKHIRLSRGHRWTLAALGGLELGTGIELDLTREQFLAGEIIGRGLAVPRPADLTGARLHGQYEELAARVRHTTGGRRGVSAA